MKHPIGMAWAGLAQLNRRCVCVAPLAAAVLLGLLASAARAQTSYSFTAPQPLNSAQTQTIPVTIQTAGSVSAVSVLTQGNAGRDYVVDTSVTPTNPCQAGQFYTQGATCNVAVKFTPQYPGARPGAIVLASGSGALATVFLSGTGQGALQVMVPGVINTIAGNGAWNYDGDNQPATHAALFLPMGGQMDAAGNLYISDSQNNRIRMVNSAGTIFTVAGNGTAGFGGDGGLATAAELSSPSAVIVDGAGNLYISDEGNAVIRRVDGVTHLITTIAGQPQQPGFTVDGGLATAASLDHPEGLAIDGAGNLYVADTFNNKVREINIQTGIITEYAGTGTPGYSGEGLPATSSMLSAPWGIAFGPDGSLYIADLDNNRVRRVDAVTSVMTTVAGTGKGDFAGDNGLATAADLNSPGAVTLDPAGNLYIADSSNNRVRKVIAQTGDIETIIGADPDSAIGDGEPSTSGGLYGPYGLFLDGSGNLYVSDMFHNLVREVNSSLVTLTYSTIRQGRTSEPQPETIENDGNAAMTLSTLDLVSNSALDPTVLQACTANESMPLGAFCNLGVEFLPTVTGDPVTGQLLVQTTAFNSPSTINLTGEVLSVDPTQTALSANPNPAALNQAVTFTAAVTWTNSGTVTPTGTVQFLDGSTPIGQGTLNALATTTLTTSSLALGSHSITAVYSGDNNNFTSTSPVVTEVVKQSTSTVLVPSMNPSTSGTQVTFTATVTAATGTPSGTVTFKDGTTTLGSSSLVSGVTTFSSSTLSAGSHSITAVYSGDSVNEPSTSSVLAQTVQLDSTSTALSASANNIAVGTALTLTAQVTGAGPTQPTGQVKFFDGGTLLQSVAIDGTGKAQISVSTLTVATHQLTAAYQGDANNATSTSAPLSETIDAISTTTLLGASANPSPAGAKLTLTATVTPSAGTGGPLSGTVTFKEGATTLGTGTVNGSGVATLVISSLAVNTHSIVASYGGVTNFSASSSVALSVVIQQATTSVQLITSGSPANVGAAITFTATVTGTGGTPTGTVTFADGGTTLQTVTLSGSGVAALTTSSLNAGTHTITAVYNGDADDIGSSSNPVTQVVQQASSSTVLNASPTSAAQGALVSFTATVSGSGGTPTGTVTFEDGGAPLGNGALDPSGVASFSTSGLTSGSHSITAVYGGDTNHTGSTSTAVVVKVLPTTAVSLTSSAPTAPAGSTVVFNAAVSGQASVPTGTVTFKDGAAVLGASGLDNTGRASFSTAGLALGGHSITASYSGDSANAASVSAALNQQIVQATTQTLLSTSAQVASAGASVTLTASVSGNGGTPGGTVTFKDGAATLGTGTLNAQGVASFSTTSLSVTTHTITAVYAGDTNDGGSTSSSVTVVVQLASTTVAISSSANPSTATVPVTLNAVVKSGGDTPTGQVIWKDSGTIIGTTALDATGATQLTTSALSVGTHNITASYQGDSNNSAAVSTVLVQTVQAATSAITLNSSVNPSLYQGAVLLTATVTATNGTPTGTVTFTDGATPLGSAPVNASGAATLSISTLAIGAHSIVAAYSGDANHSASQSVALSQSVLQVTSTALTTSANPATATTSLTLTATVTGQNGVAITGAVVFKDGATSLGSATLNGTGVATLSLSTLSVGAHALTAVYSGDSKNQASTSSTLTQTIQSATTQVTLTSSANPATAGAALTLTAKVVSLSGDPVTGSITFADGSTPLGAAPMNGAGVATLTLSTLTPGPHALTAAYSGDGENSASSSPTLNESVLQVTSTALASSENPALALDPVVLTATVSNGAATAPSGSVTFTDGTTTLGTVALANGVAVLSLPSLPVGAHPITASYAGDTQNFPSSSVVLTQTVQLRPTTDTLTASAVAQGSNQEVTLISVVRWIGPVTPTGTVSFTNGSSVLGTSPVDGTGVATLTLVLTGGATVVSSYSGDASYAASSSSSTTINPVPQTTEFTMTSSASSATIQSKQYTTVQLTLTSRQGYSDMMKLGCLGLPYAATCTFSSDSVALPANGQQTVTLTLDTGTPLTAGGEAKLERAVPTGHSPLSLAWLLPGGSLLGLVGWRGRKRLRGVVLLIVVGLAISAGITGCSSSLNVNGTPTGTYAITITATGNASGATQAMNFQLTVQ